MKTKMENFEQGFADGAGTISAQCHCGRSFYEARGLGFEVGELEKLEADPKATALEWGASFMSFEGTTYVMDCSCWKERAARLMAFIDSHAHKIAKYLKLEKERKTAEASASAEVV